MIVAAAKVGLHKDAVDFEFPRVGEIPFTSESKRMTTLHRESDGQVAYAKGAPETILASCSRQRTAQGDVPLDDARREAILGAVQEMADEALRVLAVATKEHATP